MPPQKHNMASYVESKAAEHQPQGKLPPGARDSHLRAQVNEMHALKMSINNQHTQPVHTSAMDTPQRPRHKDTAQFSQRANKLAKRDSYGSVDEVLDSQSGSADDEWDGLDTIPNKQKGSLHMTSAALKSKAGLYSRVSTPSSYPETTHGSIRHSPSPRHRVHHTIEPTAHYKDLIDSSGLVTEHNGGTTSSNEENRVVSEKVMGPPSTVRANITQSFHQENVVPRGVIYDIPSDVEAGRPKTSHGRSGGFANMPRAVVMSGPDRRSAPHSPRAMRVNTTPSIAERLSDNMPSTDTDGTSSVQIDPKLGISKDELLSTDFTALQKTNVDQSAPVQIFPPPFAEGTLSERLSKAVVSRDPDGQEALLNTLDMAAWEEAGDWFIGRIRDVMQRMVHLRKEKRHLALVLEKQIAARHAVVKRKHEVLAESREELKENSKRVVPDTPRKKVKTNGVH